MFFDYSFVSTKGIEKAKNCDQKFIFFEKIQKKAKGRLVLFLVFFIKKLGLGHNFYLLNFSHQGELIIVFFLIFFILKKLGFYHNLYLLNFSHQDKLIIHKYLMQNE